MNYKLLSVSAALLTPLTSSAVPLAVQPLNVTDINPMSVGFEVPENTAPAALRPGEWQGQLGINIANTLHIEETHTGETLEVDAESRRYALSLEYGLTEDWDVRLNVPLIDHGSGSLDGFVDDFYGTLGLPEGDRPSRAKDQFLVRYDINGQALLNVQQAQSGLGDISLSFVRTVETDYEDLLSYGARFKFATGDEEHLTGSGANGLSLWATAANELSAQWKHYMTAGAVAQEKNKGLLARVRKDVYGFARYGMTWRPSRLWELKLQLDYQSDMYKDSETRLLNYSTALALGSTLYFVSGWDLDIAVIGGVDTGTSSDVVLHFNVRKRFGR